MIQEYTTIYQETNPYGSLVAHLEDDSRTVYLYLQSEQNPEWKIRALWVKNRIPAPAARNEEDFQNGMAPLLCAHEITADADTDEIKASDVYFIWTEEGDGLAVFVKDKLTAFLPPWHGLKNVIGYSRYAKTDTIVANPLGDSDHGVFADLVEKARKFWEFRAEPNSWKQIQAARLNFLEAKLGSHVKYWSADGGKFPNVGIARFEPKEYPGVAVFSTIGMSGQNMPTVELYHKDYLNYARIELVIAAKIGEEDKTEIWIPHFLGELVKFPWALNKWLGEGHTISLSRRDPDSLYLNFTNLFLTKKISQTNTKDLSFNTTPDLNGLVGEFNQPVNFFFMLPISDEETYYVRSEGAASLLKLIEEKGIGWVHDSEREALL